MHFVESFSVGCGATAASKSSALWPEKAAWLQAAPTRRQLGSQLVSRYTQNGVCGGAVRHGHRNVDKSKLFAVDVAVAVALPLALAFLT